MKYLISSLFNQYESSWLLRLRTKCLIETVQPTGTERLQIPCNIFLNSLNSETVQENINKIVFEDLFSEKIFRQKEVTTLYQLLLETRERILSSPAAKAAPLLCGNTHELSFIIINTLEINFTYFNCLFFALRE